MTAKFPFTVKHQAVAEKKDEEKETGYLNTEQFTTTASNSSDLSTQPGTSCSPGFQGFPSQGSDRAKSWTGQTCTLHLGTACPAVFPTVNSICYTLLTCPETP